MAIEINGSGSQVGQRVSRRHSRLYKSRDGSTQSSQSGLHLGPEGCTAPPKKRPGFEAGVRDGRMVRSQRSGLRVHCDRQTQRGFGQAFRQKAWLHPVQDTVDPRQRGSAQPPIAHFVQRRNRKAEAGRVGICVQKADGVDGVFPTRYRPSAEKQAEFGHMGCLPERKVMVGRPSSRELGHGERVEQR